MIVFKLSNTDVEPRKFIQRVAELPTEYNDLMSELPLCLRMLYSNIGISNTSAINKFEFTTLETIQKCNKAYTNFIDIGTKYAGMGYFWFFHII